MRRFGSSSLIPKERSINQRNNSNKETESEISYISRAFFLIKNFVFKIIVPIVLISTLVFLLNLHESVPSFYRPHGMVGFDDHGNGIANHNDGFSDGVLTGGIDLDDQMENGEYLSDGDGDNGDKRVMNF